MATHFISFGVCNRFGPPLSFCKQGTPHPSPQESDWSSKEWDGTKTKSKTEKKKETGETNLLLDWDLPKPQSEPNPRTEVDKLDTDKLHIEQDSPKEEQVKVTDSLVPLPMSEEERATMEETTEETTEELTEVGEEVPTKGRKVCATSEGLHM